MALDEFRQSARWVNDAYVALTTFGGFATVGLQNMINWIANDTTTSAQIGDEDRTWPVTSTYFTIAIDRDGKERFHAEYDDPAIAGQLGDRVRQKGNSKHADVLDFVAS